MSHFLAVIPDAASRRSGIMKSAGVRDDPGSPARFRGLPAGMTMKMNGS
jgi:hypothetical protein